jgi:hypothetical protein
MGSPLMYIGGLNTKYVWLVREDGGNSSDDIKEFTLTPLMRRRSFKQLER